MKRSKIFFALITCLICTISPPLPMITAAFAQDCLDYAEYIPIIGSTDTPGDATDVVLADGYAYVADGTSLIVIDISDSALPQIVGSVDTPEGAFGVAIAGDS